MRRCLLAALLWSETFYFVTLLVQIPVILAAVDVYTCSVVSLVVLVQILWTRCHRCAHFRGDAVSRWVHTVAGLIVAIHEALHQTLTCVGIPVLTRRSRSNALREGNTPFGVLPSEEHCLFALASSDAAPDAFVSAHVPVVVRALALVLSQTQLRFPDLVHVSAESFAASRVHARPDAPGLVPVVRALLLREA